MYSNRIDALNQVVIQCFKSILRSIAPTGATPGVFLQNLVIFTII